MTSPLDGPCPFWGHNGAQCCGLGQPQTPGSSFASHGTCRQGTRLSQCLWGAGYRPGTVERFHGVHLSRVLTIIANQWGHRAAGLGAQGERVKFRTEILSGDHLRQRVGEAGHPVLREWLLPLSHPDSGEGLDLYSPFCAYHILLIFCGRQEHIL